MVIYSDEKVNKDGSPRKLGGIAAVSKKISQAGTVDNYENILRSEGAQWAFEQVKDRLDRIEEFMQGKEVIEKEQPIRTLRRIK